MLRSLLGLAFDATAIEVGQGCLFVCCSSCARQVVGQVLSWQFVCGICRQLQRQLDKLQQKLAALAQVSPCDPGQAM